VPVVVLGATDPSHVLDDHVLAADEYLVVAARTAIELLRDRADQPGLVALVRVADQARPRVRQILEAVHVLDCRRAGPALALACAAVIAAVPAASASAPPSRAAIERAAERFLASEPDRLERARGSGGQGVGSAGAPLPASRVVAFYGAPQMGQTILGLRSPAAAARGLAKQAAPYATLGEAGG